MITRSLQIKRNLINFKSQPRANFLRLITNQGLFLGKNYQKMDKSLDKYGRPYPPKAGRYHVPKITVDAVCVKKVGNEEHILMVTRGNNPHKGSLALPGGFVDYNEEPKDAVLRELEEETEAKGSSPELVGVFGHPLRDPRGHTITIAYKVLVDQGAQIKAGDDAADAQWYPMGDILALGEKGELSFDHYDIIKASLS